jgi:protein-S-isoprenylcysteine O-methyltransferase Ste14
MTLTIAKAIFVLCVIASGVIRHPHQRRSRRIPVRTSARDGLERMLLVFAGGGLVGVPALYVFSPLLRAADYTFHQGLAWAGTVVFLGALWVLYRSHRDLGRNFSVSLELRNEHRLVTNGIYAHVRHPMYLAFWLWALAQALLLPNWIAGLAGLTGFGILFFFRIRREERLMLEAFGEQYRSYMGRTARIVPWIY